ncbi:BCCT family transporter [Halomonas sp. NCCP-2165]|nr:BCCT family transporter [Halomonas sp. NCCP-2165]GKW49585.1 choline transporter [Halomonas sp. NCCP-2165]
MSDHHDDPSQTGPLNPAALQIQQRGLLKGAHRGMTLTAAAIILAFVLFTAFDTSLAGTVFGSARAWIESTFSAYYIITLVFLIAVCFGLMLSPFGKVRLGDDDSRPEFSTFAWIAMLFSAGIGIGILFFGVAEPLFYLDTSAAFGYPNNPYADLAGATALGHERAVSALAVTYFHWGLHGWAVYVLVGLSLAYFAYRKKLPLALRSALYPFIGERIYGPIGHLVDILAVFGAVFGVATSLGLGVSQIATGLERLFGIDPGNPTQLALIAIISALSILSAVSGVGRGIKLLSQWNIILSVLLLGFFLFAGPTGWLLGMFGDSLGHYLGNFVQMGLWFPEEPGPSQWQGDWTIFYWGWWLAWAPFVGLFIARISKGRTLREYMACVMIIPTAIIIGWLCVFGGVALHQELTAGGEAGLITLVQNWNLPAALYGTIDGLAATPWLAWAVSALATLLLASWFITSSDSGTLVITTILSLGNDEPSRPMRIFWGAVIGAVAAVLLLAGGLGALQTASIAAALPLSVVIILMTLGVLKSLIQNPAAVRRRRRAARAGAAMGQD